jgi:hypothetical protein
MDYRHDADTDPTGAWQAPWETHDQVLRRAHAARARLLHNMVVACAGRLRERICAVAETLRVRLCPLCCQ